MDIHVVAHINLKDYTIQWIYHQYTWQNLWFFHCNGGINSCLMRTTVPEFWSMAIWLCRLYGYEPVACYRQVACDPKSASVSPRNRTNIDPLTYLMRSRRGRRAPQCVDGVNRVLGCAKAGEPSLNNRRLTNQPCWGSERGCHREELRNSWGYCVVDMWHWLGRVGCGLSNLPAHRSMH